MSSQNRARRNLKLNKFIWLWLWPGLKARGKPARSKGIQNLPPPHPDLVGTAKLAELYEFPPSCPLRRTGCTRRPLGETPPCVEPGGLQVPVTRRGCPLSNPRSVPQNNPPSTAQLPPLARRSGSPPEVSVAVLARVCQQPWPGASKRACPEAFLLTEDLRFFFLLADDLRLLSAGGRPPPSAGGRSPPPRLKTSAAVWRRWLWQIHGEPRPHTVVRG